MNTAKTEVCHHPKSGFGRVWHLTPTKTQQSVWLYCCAKTGKKAIAFIFEAIHDKCCQVMFERARAGRECPQWVMEELDAQKRGFQDVKRPGLCDVRLTE